MSSASPSGRAGGLRPEPVAQPQPEALIPDAGTVYAIPYPFVRDKYFVYDEEGGFERDTWKPGVRFEAIAPDDCGAVADAVGQAVFTLVDTFKPGKFPRRAFFTRVFIDPDGRAFGKPRLHIATLEKFRRLTRGYQHPFGIGEPYGGHVGQRLTMDQFLNELREYAASQDAPEAPHSHGETQ